MMKQITQIIVNSVIVLVLLVGLATPIFADLQGLPAASGPKNQRDQFQTNLFTGSAQYSYPIKVPKGTHDLTPEVSLSYNNQGSVDYSQLTGSGWDVNRDYIQRNVNFTPSDSSDDKFLLHFKGTTYKLTYNPIDSLFHTTVESHLKIQQFLSGGSNTTGMYWQVTAPDGTLYRFGYLTNSELVCNGQSFGGYWYLDQVQDTHNNHIYYSYTQSSGVAYLSQIKYNNEQLREVDFTYVTNPYQRQAYVQGCNATESNRLSSVLVKANASLVHEYDLSFSQSLNSQNLLNSITEKGSDGSSLPATTFTYNPEVHSFATSYYGWSNSSTTAGINNANVAISDVNGDGLPDVVVSNGGTTWNVFLSTGSTLATTSQTWLSNASGVDLSYSNIRLMDVNGDGLPDIVRSDRSNGDLWRVYLNTGSSWNATPQTWFTADVGVQISYSNVRLMDVNGDGLPDIVRSDRSNGDLWRVYMNTGSGWNSTPQTWFTADMGVQLGYTNVRLIDVNGDGLPDIVWSTGGTTWKVLVNNGSSWVPTWQTWLSNASGVDLSYNNIAVIDLNGDGLPDILRTDNGSLWRVYLNTGNGWNVNPETWFNVDLGSGLQYSNIKIADINGDGLPDIVYGDYNGLFIHVYANNGAAPNQLSTVQTQQGGTIHFDYAPSTQYLNTALPFNVSVVKKMTLNNGLTNAQATSSVYAYSYKNGLYNSANREFRGFGEVDVTSPNNAITQTTFAQDDALKGNLLKTYTFDAQNNPYAETDNTWNSTLANSIYTVTLGKTQNYTYDGVANNPKITETDYQYDSYGNPTKISDLGDTSITGDERYTHNEYATNSPVWIVNKLAHTYLNASDDVTKVSEQWEYYDGATPSATPTPTPTPGFSLNDKTSNGDNLTNTGGVTASTSTPFAGGNTYSASLTKSSSQYLSAASGAGSALDVNGNITLELWVKFTSLPSNALWGLASKWSPGNDSYLFGINDSGGTKALHFWVNGGATVSSNITVSTGVWTYLAVTFNNSTKAVNFYQSTGGTPTSVGSGTAPSNMTSSAGVFQIGSWDLANTLDGTVDEVRVWNTPRTLTQLSTSYNSKLVGNESGLVGYFPFEAIGQYTDISTLTKGDLSTEIKWKNTSGTNSATLYSYDSYGNQTGVTDDNNHTTQYVYGITDTTNTYPEKMINAKNQTTLYSYNLGTGNLTSKTDPNGYVTSYTYDVFGRPTSEIDPYDSSSFPTVSYQYFDASVPQGKLVAKRTTAGNTNTYNTYTFSDGLGRTLQTRSDAKDTTKQIVTDIFYNPMGLVSSQTIPHLDTLSTTYAAPVSGTKTITSAYDAIGRLTTLTNPDLTTKQTAYDHWKKTLTDENNHTKTQVSNAYGKIIEVDEQSANGVGLPYTTLYLYDPKDQLTKITDNAGNNTTFTHDSLGNKITQVDPDMGTWQYTYDGVGNMLTQTDSRGVVTTKSYDGLNRLIQVTLPSDPTITYTYDSTGNIGNLTSVTDAAGTVAYSYDQRHRKTQESRLTDGITWTTAYSYDSADRLVNTTKPDGEVITNTYNPQGEIASMSGLLTATDYNAQGNVTNKTLANTLSTNYTYDTSSFRLNRIQTGALQDISYTYDNVGNVVNTKDNLTNITQTFGYDFLNRLTSASSSDGTYNYTYAYDPLGNLIQFTNALNSVTYTYGQQAGPHAVTSSTQTTITPAPTPTPGFSLNDKTSNGDNLTNTGGVTASTSTPFAGGNTYSASLTKSSSQYLSAASGAGSALDVNGNITLELWVKFTSLPSNALWGLASKWSGGGAYLFGINDSGGTKTLQFWVNAGGINSSPITVSTGQWTYLAVTFNNSTRAVNFYQLIGGTPTLVGSGTAPSNMTSSAAPFQIGSWDLANTLDGTVDEVRVWNTPRTLTQLSTSYNSKLVGNESGLVGYFPFETP